MHQQGSGGMKGHSATFCGVYALSLNLSMVLDLQRNNIGDDGMRSLADAFSKGAMASLQHLFVDYGHPALKAACDARGIQVLERSI